MNTDRPPLDVATIDRIAAAAAAADGSDPLDEYARMTLRNRPDRVLHAIDGDAFALGYDRQVAVVTAPDSRGKGLGGRLLHDVLAGLGEGPVEAWSHGDHPAAARLAAQHEFTRVRDLWVMRLPASVELPEIQARTWELRPYRPQDAADLLRVNAAAFAEHPEQGEMDEANLADRMAEDWFDPNDLLIAERAGVMLGFHWTKRHTATVGEVYVVAVAPQAQGQGLGRALTLAGLDHLRRQGVADVHLYVESDNGPAVAVYTRLGFTHADTDTHVMYARA